MLWGQKEFISIESSNNPVEKGQRLIITIKSNVEGTLDFDLPDEFEQSGATESGMSSEVSYYNGRGKVVRFSYEKISGQFDDEGTYRVGPAKITGKNGVVESNILEIKVVKRQNMISENPADNMNRAIFGIIEQSGREIYEGQPLILEGKVYAQVDILQVERYFPFQLEGPSESHELQQSNQVTRNYEQIAGRNVMTFRIGKMLIFPEKTGEFVIDPFETILFYDDKRSVFPERTKVRSNQSKVIVKPLPDGVPPSFIEGVGEFKLEANVDTTELEQGSVLTIKIYVFGHGNLHNIEPPKLNLPKGMILYGDPEVDDSVLYTSRGSEGMKSFTYYVQANKSGDIKIPAIKAGYFDLTSEEYQVLDVTLPVIKVNPSEDAIAAGSTQNSQTPDIQEKLLPPMDHNDLKIVDDSMFVGLEGVLWTSTPIVLAFLMGAVVRRRKSTEALRANRNEQNETKQKVLQNLNDIGSDENDVETLQSVKLAVQNYLAIKFKVETSVISSTYINSLSDDKMAPETKSSVISLFKSIDELRYSGGAVKGDGEHIAKTAKRVINEV